VEKKDKQKRAMTNKKRAKIVNKRKTYKKDQNFKSGKRR